MLYIFDFSTAHHSHVILFVADSVTETEVLNSILLSVTSDDPKVVKSGVPIATEIDASKKHAPALDDVAAASVAVAPRGDATLSDLDYISLISKVFLAFELCSHFKQNVSDAVPQIPTYIFLPNTLFHIDWMDISNQNKQLEALWTVFHRSLKIDKILPYFHMVTAEVIVMIQIYQRLNMVMEVSLIGYGGELDYNAIEAGALLKISRAYTVLLLLGLWGHMVNYPYNF